MNYQEYLEQIDILLSGDQVLIYDIIRNRDFLEALKKFGTKEEMNLVSDLEIEMEAYFDIILNNGGVRFGK